MLLKGGETVKSLSIAFLADLEEDWRYFQYCARNTRRHISRASRAWRASSGGM
jgi:hypothetical protein